MTQRLGEIGGKGLDGESNYRDLQSGWTGEERVAKWKWTGRIMQLKLEEMALVANNTLNLK